MKAPSIHPFYGIQNMRAVVRQCPPGIFIVAGLLALSLIDVRPGPLKPYVMALAILMPAAAGWFWPWNGRRTARMVGTALTLSGFLLFQSAGWAYPVWALVVAGCWAAGIWSYSIPRNKPVSSQALISSVLIFILVGGLWAGLRQSARFGLFPYQRGVWTARYPDGNVQYHHHYFRGVLHGVQREYYPDGRIREEGTYQFGRRQGVLTQFLNDGRKINETEYENGRPQRSVRYAYINGGTQTWRWDAASPDLVIHRVRHINGSWLYEDIFRGDRLETRRINHPHGVEEINYLPQNTE